MSTKRKKFALIGPGKVGTALSYLLCQKGYQLTGIVGRSNITIERARQVLQERYWPQMVSTNLRDLNPDLDFLLLGVGDEQIAEVMKEWQKIGHERTNQVLIHLSGAHVATAGLKPTSLNDQLGYLAFHPLQAVSDINQGIELLPQAVWSLEGNSRGLSLGEELVRHLQLQWIKITAEQKPLYHAAACIVSNYLVTLTQIGMEMLQEIGFPQELARSALLPLIQGTVSNLVQNNPEQALTGPIVRGDVETIHKHLQAIKNANRRWLALYKTLGRETIELANTSFSTTQQLKEILEQEGEFLCKSE